MKKLIALTFILSLLALNGCFLQSEEVHRSFTTPDPIELDTDPSAPDGFNVN